MIIILSTHIVDDVSDLCSQMAIIHEGELRYSGEPLAAINAMHGKVWKKLINKDELEVYQQRYTILSTKLYVGMLALRVYQEADPGDGFEAAEVHLEDVYFHHLGSQTQGE
jgi:ABC-type multidrug transport system ATPase subunit